MLPHAHRAPMPSAVTGLRVCHGALVTLGGLLAAAGCARDQTPASATVTWTVAAAPIVTLGRDTGDGAILLERITGATRLPDGRILVADVGSAPLRMFAPDGRQEAVRARDGSGPGEFEYLARLFACGDSLYAYDIGGRRVSALTPEGRFLRHFRFSIPEGQQAPYLSACTPDGRFVHIGWGVAPTVAAVHRDTVPVWVTATPEGSPAVIDTVPGSERWGQTYNGRVVGSRPLPFGKQPHVAAGRTRLYLATGDGFTVRVYDREGQRLPTTLTASVPAAPVSPDDIREIIEAEVRNDGEQYRRGIEREFGSITYPAVHAPITALLVDAADHLWVRAYAHPAATAAIWRVFSPEGALIATAELPQALAVLEIGEDYVLGSSIDPTSGVPVVQLHTLRRSGNPQ